MLPLSKKGVLITGRSVKASSAEKLRAAANEYFASCDATRERLQLKNGELAYHQVPYTLAGLCAALGLEKEYVKNAKDGATTGLKEAERAVLSWAALKVEQYTVERALLGELNSAVASVLLKDWGYGQGLSSAALSEIKVVLEDPEGLSC